MSNESTALHPLANLVGEIIVVDTASPYVYVGRLQSLTSFSIELNEADCHDLRDSLTNREKYVMDCRVHGVSPNRQRTWVRMDEIVGWCRLNDVIVE
ncbi:MAG: hypothetical protein MPJ50_15695 [Pirellulales bacterium]|nr:hypothetical protein [Pirellulales bacterium]